MRINIIYIVGVAIAVITLFTFYFNFSNSRNIRNYPASGTNIVAFGDSLVFGVGASEGNDFVSVLSAKFGIKIKNLGKSGDTTASGLLRIGELLDSDPDIVLLLLGGNDYLRKMSKEETFVNLGRMIESLQDSGAIVVLLGVRGGILNDNYKNDFKELSKKYKTIYVEDVLKGIIGRSNLMYDAIHPNDDGYRMIADKIYPVVLRLIN